MSPSVHLSRHATLRPLRLGCLHPMGFEALHIGLQGERSCESYEVGSAEESHVSLALVLGTALPRAADGC